MTLSTGSRIGGYEIVSLLGTGGMGEVYLAEDKHLPRKVAIKLLPFHLTQDADRVRRFEQEARAASALNHPNIITIYDIGDSQAGRFISMEFVAGHTLRALIGQPTAFEKFIAWGSQVAEALAVAHAAGIVHRDIKPENIMVRDDGYVKLLDFGVARLSFGEAISAEGATVAGTHPGALIGTLRYMSPEQAAGDRVTPAADMFALGVVLYELATGQHPLNAGTLLELAQALATQTPAAPSRRVPSLPAAFDTLLLRLLEKDGERRPSASDVRVMLSKMGREGARSTATSVGFSDILGVLPPRSSMVGRERERTALRAAFQSAHAGRGSLLCIAGEPGIGKTTLVEDVLAEVAGGAWRIARGRCSERLAGTEAYLPWLEALDSLHRGAHGESTMQRMRRIAPTWFAQVARASDDQSEAALEAELRSASQERLKRELVLLLEELSSDRPLVLFIDDLHWADVSTIDLLTFVANRLTLMRLLIMATYRPTDLQLVKHPFLQIRPDLQARGICRELQLEFLNQADIARYLALEFPGHRFPAEFPSLIHAKTEGSPLFMADLVRYLRDREAITQEQGSWALARAVPALEGELPESVRGMIERKIAQLSDHDRRLLVVASVQGYQFDSTVVAKALRADQAEIEEQLEALERVHAFVRLVTDEELPDRTLTLRYRFVHVLYQRALYDTLRPTRRAALSKAMADALLACYGEQRGRVAPALANLYETSRNFSEAADYFLLAAQNATRIFASHEAIALARRGLEALAMLPDSLARGRQELALLLTLGWPLINVSGYAAAEVEQTYERARELCQRTGEAVELYRALWGLAMCYLNRADHAKTRELATNILRLAQETRDPAAFITAHYMLGTVSVYLGEIASAREHYAEGIALGGRQRELTLPDGRDPGVSCRAQMGRVLWLLGYPERAIEVSETAQRQAHVSAQPKHDLAFALFLDMLLRQCCREIAQTQQRAEALMALADEHALPLYGTWARILSGWTAAEAEPAAGVVRMRESLAAYGRMGNALSRPHFLALLAQALSRDGRSGEGLLVVHEALASMERTGERYYEAELHRLEGELLCASGPDGHRAEAEACFHRALDVARRQSAKSLELRAATSLARLWKQKGRSADARALLAPIYGWFTEGFDKPDLRDAHALLDS